jgi:hypothetical protein
MVEQRNEDPEDLDEDQVGHIVNVLNMIVKDLSSAHCGRIRVHMHEEKDPQRNNSGQLMEFSQEESVAKSDGHFRV